MKYKPLLIGEDCEAAHRFRQSGISILDGPFNRIGITYQRLIKLLEEDFENFCLKQNLKIEQKLIDYPNSYGNHYRVVEFINNKIGTELWHNFTINQDFEENYLNFSKEQSEKIKIFENTLKYDLRAIMLIHKKTDVRTLEDHNDIKNQYINLNKIIKKIRNGKPYKIAALGHGEIFHEKWNIENVNNYKINTQKLWGKENIIEDSWKEIINLCTLTKILL